MSLLPGPMAQDMLILRFGDQMNNVAVTDGDKVTAEQVLGYHVDYCPVNDLMVYYQAVEDKDVQALVATYFKEYEHDAALEQTGTEAYTKVWNSAKAEIALRRLLKDTGAKDLQPISTIWDCSIRFRVWHHSV